MLVLLTVNIFLCVKLNEIDRMTDRLVQNYPSWLNRYSYEQDDNNWSLLLKKQEDITVIDSINITSFKTKDFV